MTGLKGELKIVVNICSNLMILGNVYVVRVLFLVCLEAMSHILPSSHIFPLSPNVRALSRYKNQKASINKEAERVKGFFF